MANELNKALWITAGGILGTIVTCYLVGQVQKDIALDREWAAGDRVALEMDMPVELVRASLRVYEDVGKIAVSRGPLVYLN